jgi:NADH-quinone oxidoreductase subunit C
VIIQKCLYKNYTIICKNIRNTLELFSMRETETIAYSSFADSDSLAKSEKGLAESAKQIKFFNNAYQQAEKFIDLFSQKLPNDLKNAVQSLGINICDAELLVKKESVIDLLTFLKNGPEFNCNLLLSITAVDWLDSRLDRFQVVYHLLSFSSKIRVRVKVDLEEEAAQLPTSTVLWDGANFMEREVWDMYGIVFTEHPYLERILMYPEFKGHPLRKDYPVQGKQPRIKLRASEVHNTARDMRRSALVQIKPKVT